MANYPTSASTDANLYVAVNSLATSLVGALTSVGGNNGADIEVTSTAGFPSAGFITIDQEAISYTSLLSSPARFSGITRGADGTTATSHSAGSTVKHNVLAAHHNVLKEEVKAIETDLVAVKAALNDADTPASTAADVKDRFDQVVSQIKTMHGQTNWYSAAKAYSNLFKYRRPSLRWQSATNVDCVNLTATSAERAILFPDGDYRTTTNSTLYEFVITRNAIFNGSNQSGLRSSLSETTNTWYAIYAVKEQNANAFVLVGDTTLPLVANIATLDSAYGTNSWVYLGMIRNGDNAGITGDILKFSMVGNFTVFRNSAVIASSNTHIGTLLASTASANSLTYTYSAGTGTTQIPNNLEITRVLGEANTSIAADRPNLYDASATHEFDRALGDGLGRIYLHACDAPNDGFRLDMTSTNSINIWLTGFFDSALGVGSNPLI